MNAISVFLAWITYKSNRSERVIDIERITQVKQRFENGFSAGQFWGENCLHNWLIDPTVDMDFSSGKNDQTFVMGLLFWENSPILIVTKYTRRDTTATVLLVIFFFRISVIHGEKTGKILLSWHIPFFRIVWSCAAVSCFNLTSSQQHLFSYLWK